MKMHLVAVPPGGGEAEFQLELDSEYVPRTGEYLVVDRTDDGRGFFQVRSVTTVFAGIPEDELRNQGVYVEAEFVEHQYASEEHKDAIERFKARGLEVKGYPESGF